MSRLLLSKRKQPQPTRLRHTFIHQSNVSFDNCIDFLTNQTPLYNYPIARCVTCAFLNRSRSASASNAVCSRRLNILEAFVSQSPDAFFREMQLTWTALNHFFTESSREKLTVQRYYSNTWLLLKTKRRTRKNNCHYWLLYVIPLT